ncbi:MAG TPA: hypothetical protein VMF06_05110 [Candidatus Limnocylindria bacterium]|jgi:hypothetical protein|nr:hypothetical protein [Candidatus Limnocylindria bacterium]
MSAANNPDRIVALNSSPAMQAGPNYTDLVAKLAGMRELRCRKQSFGDLTTYISTVDDLARWNLFHAAIVEGNFYPLKQWPEEKSSTPQVVFGLVVGRQLADWFRAVPHYRLIRQIEAGLAALYHMSSEQKQHVLRCQLYGPMLDRVLEAHDRYFTRDGFDLCNESKTFIELRRDFDDLVSTHAGVRPFAAFPLFFDLDSLFLEEADAESVLQEKQNWLLVESGFAFDYWVTYVRSDDWERIVENGQYDEMVRGEGSSFMYAAWERFYEKKMGYPFKQAHWRDVPKDVSLPD